MAHGIAGHSGRFTNIANYCVPRGYAVYALDHRGHHVSPISYYVHCSFCSSTYLDAVGRDEGSGAGKQG